MTEIADAEARVADWVKHIKESTASKKDADARADQESLDRAADLEKIYQAFEWVKDMPKPKARRVGRRVNPQSHEQFAKWVKQQFDWGTQQHLARLSDALSFHTKNALGVKTTEGAIRPLWALRVQGYGDHMVSVWQRAIKAAGGSPTAAQVRHQVRIFLEEHRAPAADKNVASDARTELERRAARQARLIAEFEQLLAEGDQLLSKQTLLLMSERYNSRERELNAARA